MCHSFEFDTILSYNIEKLHFYDNKTYLWAVMSN